MDANTFGSASKFWWYDCDPLNLPPWYIRPPLDRSHKLCLTNKLSFFEIANILTVKSGVRLKYCNKAAPDTLLGRKHGIKQLQSLTSHVSLFGSNMKFLLWRHLQSSKCFMVISYNPLLMKYLLKLWISIGGEDMTCVWHIYA